MTAAFATLAALCCAGSSVALAEIAHRSRRAEPDSSRRLGGIALCLLLAALGFLTWSRGA